MRVFGVSLVFAVYIDGIGAFAFEGMGCWWCGQLVLVGDVARALRVSLRGACREHEGNGIRV